MAEIELGLCRGSYRSCYNRQPHAALSVLVCLFRGRIRVLERIHLTSPQELGPNDPSRPSRPGHG